MRIASWATKGTDTRNTDFVRHTWLGRRALILCLYVKCLSVIFGNKPNMLLYALLYPRYFVLYCAFLITALLDRNML